VTLYLAQPPAGSFPSGLSRFHRNDLRVVFAQADAGDSTLGGAALTVLESLGKRPDVAGGRDGTYENVPWLVIWLRAHEVEWLVLADVQVYRPPLLGDLLRVISGTPVNVLVAPQRHASAETMAVLRGFAPVSVGWTQIGRLLPKRDRAPAAPHAAITPPLSDWYHYRADCRDLLTPEQHHVLDRHYRRAFTATRRWLTNVIPDEPSTQAFLAQTVSDARTLAEGLTRVRAAQAAFFTCGWNLRINQSRLMQALGAALNARFTDADWIALRAYRPPYRSALIALHQAGIAVGDLMAISVTEAADALTTGRLGNHRLTDQARPFLAAQLLQRAKEGTTPDAPYVSGLARTPGDVINRAARDLGLLIGSHHAPTNPHTRNFWQFRTGFHLQRL
jgi:hypothetical protein